MDGLNLEPSANHVAPQALQMLEIDAPLPIL